VNLRGDPQKALVMLPTRIWSFSCESRVPTVHWACTCNMYISGDGGTWNFQFSRKVIFFIYKFYL